MQWHFILEYSGWEKACVYNDLHKFACFLNKTKNYELNSKEGKEKKERDND